jgi:hypothetical protein
MSNNSDIKFNSDEDIRSTSEISFSEVFDNVFKLPQANGTFNDLCISEENNESLNIYMNIKRNSDISKANELKKKSNGEKIFEINKPIYRKDYYIKKFKKNFFKYLINYGRILIKKCNFDQGIKKLKFHLPNYKKYQGNPKEKANYEFLEKTVKEVFMDYDKVNDEGNANQIINEKLINNIYLKKNFPSNKEEESLKNFFEMSIEEALETYYKKSFEFNEFKKDRIIKYYDKMFYKERNRNISLLKLDEGNGFIKYVKMPFYSNCPK